MKTIVAILTLALAGFFAGCSAGNQVQPMSGKTALYGTWSCVSAIVDGKSLPEETTKLLRLTITEHTYKTEKGPEVLFESSYTTDSAKNPREIDMLGTEGELKGKQAQGIFALNGDRLEICYTMPGSERPKRFESVPGSKAYLVVWRRAP
jgi:uncharacterized protein (TIGR03067 family)